MQGGIERRVDEKREEMKTNAILTHEEFVVY